MEMFTSIKYLKDLRRAVLNLANYCHENPGLLGLLVLQGKGKLHEGLKLRTNSVPRKSASVYLELRSESGRVQ